MARRSGKASRQSRQRRMQRAAARLPAPQPPVATPDATPPADAPPAEGAAQNTPSAVTRPVSARAIEAQFQAAATSRLSERAISDYHYVIRDLRNIAVLVGVLAVLLALATIAVRALGIGPA